MPVGNEETNFEPEKITACLGAEETTVCNNVVKLSNKSVGADSDTTPDDGGSFGKTVLASFKLLLTEGWKDSFD